MITNNLKSVLACPKCNGSVLIEKEYIICKKCKLRFPIINGDIPNMIIEEAKKTKK